MANPIDNIVNFFNPSAGLKRTQARITQELVSRKYDVASQGRRNKSWFRPTSSAAQEVSGAYKLSAASAQELCRNNPLANRIKKVWANNVVGAGITLDVRAEKKNKKKRDSFNKAWLKWAETTNCDAEGHNNLYGLQWLWAATIVESGGVFIVSKINPALDFPLQLQTLEQNRLDSSKNSQGDEPVIDGIHFDKHGQIKGYWFLTDSTNTLMGQTPKSEYVDKKDAVHLFRKERAGQHLGMTWFSSNATTLKNNDIYVDAKLMQQQIAACFAVFFEESSNASGLTSVSDVLPDSIEPAMIAKLKAGTSPYTVTPPKADNSSLFDTSLRRDIAVGSGVTYEQLTGDYSKVNFASGRMGRAEFHIELDYFQNILLKVALNRVFRWFDDLYQINTVKVSSILFGSSPQGTV